MTGPTVCAQFREHLTGVIATLAGNNHVHGFQLRHTHGILQWRRVFAYVRGSGTNLRRRKKLRVYQGKILLFHHALHQHRTHHATPTDQTHF